MTDANPVLRILIVDDHEVVRIGLRTLLSRQPGFEVVGEAGSAEEAIEQALRLEPDIVVMDIRMPGTGGIEACREIVRRRPQTQVIMLTSYTEDELLFQAIEAGAAGYVLKQIGSQELVNALRAASRGESLLDPNLTRRVISRLHEVTRKDKQNAFAALNPRELRILYLLSQGLANREIAEKVFLSEKTVRNYISEILNKLGVAHRVEAAAYALKNDIERAAKQQ